MGPPDPHGSAVSQFGRPHAQPIVPEPDNPITSQNYRAVQADEQVGIESGLKPAHRLEQQIAARRCRPLADVQPHVIALGIDPVDIGDGDAEQLGAMRHPELTDPR